MLVIPKRIFVIIVLLLAVCNPSFGKTLEADPNWVQGQLDNGLRYHIYPTDDQEIAIRLMVHVGSMQEAEKQKGYAHFVEHMAFNGSRNFSGNEVIKLFEQAGGSFGADINAFTRYQLTTYKMDLSSPDHLAMALTWMRDVADGIEFNAKQVEAEKGVILGEIRATRPENKSFFRKAYDEAIKGSALDGLDPLGTKVLIEQVTAEGLKSYYDTWYQPQHTELIIAGNVDAKVMSQLVKQQFSNWQGDSNKPVKKKRDFKFNNDSRVLKISEKESPSLNFLIDRGPIAVTTRAQQQQTWLDNISEQLVQQRLQSALNDSAMAVQYAGAYSQWLDYNRFSAGGISFSSDQRGASEALFISTLRSLRDHGVSQSELESIMTSYQRTLDNIDSDWSKRKPLQIVDERVFAIEQGSTIQSKAGLKASLERFLRYSDLKRINRNLDKLLSSPVTWLVGADPTEALSSLTEDLKSLPESYAMKGVKPFLLQEANSDLLQPSGDGKIISKVDHERDLTVWQLSNGVEVWFQQDPKAGKRAHLVYASQGGKAALSPELHAAGDLLAHSALRSGLGEFSGAQLNRYLRKKDVAVYLIAGLTYHGVEINTSAEQLPLALNAVYNIATQVKIDRRQLDAVKQEVQQNNSTYFSSPEGKWYKAINANTYLPDSRHRYVMSDDVAGVTVEQTLQVHKTLFTQNRSNKLVIIANMEPEQIAPLLRKYVASILLSPALPVELDFDNGYNLQSKLQLDVAENNEKSVRMLKRRINTQIKPKSAKDIFAEDMLQKISSIRLREEVREKQGFDYSPEIFPVTQDGEFVTDWFITAKVAEQDVEKVDSALNDVLSKLSRSITEQEVATAAKQLTIALEPINDDPVERAWFYTRYLMHGYGIDALLNIERTTHSITLEDMQQRALWAFGPASRKMTAILTEKQ